MPNYRSYLPNLDSLIAFEAAARHESFTLAASELSLTQSAISHRIRTLEASLQVELFERRHRSIRLTGPGSEFYSSTVVALNHLLAASDTIRGTDAQIRFKICTDVAFANFWLEPRLLAFLGAMPGVAVDLIASDKIEDSFSRSVDAAIVLGGGDWPGYESVLLFEEEVFPVCSPGYQKRIGRIESLEDIAAADLIDLSFDKSEWLNWTIWLANKGGPAGGVNRVFQSNSYRSVMTAAKGNMGIALGWKHVIDDDLRNGSLIIPFHETVTTEGGYYLVYPNNRADNQLIGMLRDWVLGAVAEQKSAGLYE